MVLRLMLINSVFWKPQFQGGVLKSGGDVRENSGPAEHVGTLGICTQLYFWHGQKSVNLQYITLGCLDDGTNELSTKSLMFQVLFFFILFIDLGHSKFFIIIFVIL